MKNTTQIHDDYDVIEKTPKILIIPFLMSTTKLFTQQIVSLIFKARKTVVIAH